MQLPRLYKKTSTGAIQFWDISAVFSRASETGDDEVDYVATIITAYGQLGTDSPQTTYDTVKEGKNIGKKNETSPLQQAKAEAQAKWEKQKKKGYVETVEAAEAGELDALIEGGIAPMLAHKFAEQGHKIKYPAYVQPKLDGIRCIAILRNGKCTLWSRTRKPITSMPHIVTEVERLFKKDITLDGELYNHEFKGDFEKIVSAVRKENPEDGYLNVQYHVYDFVNNESFNERIYRLSPLHGDSVKYLFPVETLFVASEEDVMKYFNKFKNAGYEGAILRNADGLYANKRSYDLQKVKEFDDAEFEIIGIEEGRGKLAGHVGAFVCKNKIGTTFQVKMSGETEKLKDYFHNHKLWNGKILTVQYQGLTGKEGVPRFPVGIAIRDYE